MNSAYRLSKSSAKDFRPSSSGLQYPRDAQIDLKTYLDSLRNAVSLRLSDMAFGDEGCKTVAAYLQKNTKLESIELRANNISSDGFGVICEGLVGNNVIKTLSAEWNSLGSGIRGFEALAEFLAQNNSLEHLDLRNNKITSSSANSIANLVRASPSLQTLDLRWNELGNQGGKAILSAVESNDKIQHVELKGNNISEDIIEEIAQRLSQNGGGKQTTDKFGTRSKDFGSTLQGGDRYPRRLNDSRDDKDLYTDLQMAIQSNADLERALLAESRKNADLKEKFFKDLDLTNREFQNRIDTLTRENQQLQGQVKSVEAENSRIKKENAFISDKLSNYEDTHLKDLKAIEDYEKNLRRYENENKSSDNNYKANLERLANENHLKIVEIENEWDLKYKELLRENDYLTQRNRDLDVEVKRLAEENRQMLFNTEDKVRDAAFKSREEERQKNNTTIRQLENTLRASEEEIYRIQRDLEEKELSFQRKSNYMEDRIHQAEEEIKRLKYEVNTNVDYFNKEKLRNESLQNELLARDNGILKLESDLREHKKQLHNKEVMHQDQVDILNREHSDEKTRWEETRGTLAQRISDLERHNRSLLSELNKVKSDLNRLPELLLSNLSGAVYGTFSELK